MRAVVRQREANAGLTARHVAIVSLAIAGLGAFDQVAAQRTSPGARSGHAMAYDPINRCVLVFGGVAAGANRYHDDLWSWNGSRWSLVAQWGVGDGPSGREDALLAFDGASQRLVLRGGRLSGAGSMRLLTDTWEWDGRTWAFRDSLSAGVRLHGNMAFDSASARVIMFGGVSTDRRELRSDGRAWDGSSWRLLLPPTLLDTVLDGGAAISGLGVLTVPVAITQGGSDGWAPTGVLRWSGSAWERLEARNAPRISPKVPVSPGPLPGSLVMFDGACCMTDRSPLTWVWQSGSWTRIAGPQPSKRRGANMVYDAARHRVVLFGGDSGTALLADLWEFDGARWTLVATGNPR